MPNSIVLDSYALIAFLKQEPGYKAVAQWLTQAKDNTVRLGVSVVNLGEVWYRAARWRSPADADQIVQNLRALEIEVVEADWALTQVAAHYKMRGNIAYADCFAAALAKLWDAPLVTGDREFKQLQSEIKILWL